MKTIFLFFTCCDFHVLKNDIFLFFLQFDFLIASSYFCSCQYDWISHLLHSFPGWTPGRALRSKPTAGLAARFAPRGERDIGVPHLRARLGGSALSRVHPWERVLPGFHFLWFCTFLCVFDFISNTTQLCTYFDPNICMILLFMSAPWIKL